MTTKEYNQCVDLYADNIYRFILKNTRQVEEAQDVVQNAFEVLWNNHERIQFSKARAYLFTTAYHNMIDQIRKKKRISLEEDLSEVAQSKEDSFNGLQDALNTALNRLSNMQRSIVLLRDYEGYSYREIGDILALSESQVKVYLFRARKHLKSYLVSIETLL